METGAILTPREVGIIRERLQKVSFSTSDRKVREQCRMILSTMGKAERRARRKPGDDRNRPAIEVVYDPFTEELIFKD